MLLDNVRESERQEREVRQNKRQMGQSERKTHSCRRFGNAEPLRALNVDLWWSSITHQSIKEVLVAV